MEVVLRTFNYKNTYCCKMLILNIFNIDGKTDTCLEPIYLSTLLTFS
jgi:hypothetical protein